MLASNYGVIGPLKFPAILLLAISCSGAGSDQRVSAEGGKTQVAAIAQPDSVVRGITVGRTHIDLNGNTTFLDIQRVWGPATVYEPADRDDTWKICYRVSDPVLPVFLVLAADEVGGPDHRIDEVSVSTAEPRQLTTSECGVLNQTGATVETDNGLRLGMARDSIARIMGTPIESDIHTEVYEFDKIVTQMDSATSREVPVYSIYGSFHVQYDAADHAVLFTALYGEMS